MQKNLKIILGALLSIIIIISIYFIYRNNTKTIQTPKILKNASMIIKEGTLTNTGCTVIITDTEKEEIHTYGNSFGLEIKKNNKWQELKPIEEKYAFTLEGYNVDEDNELAQHIEWEWLYGKLEPGEYRLVKDAAINYKNSYLGSGVVYAEFTIEPNLEVVKIGLITNDLTNTIPISIDESTFILHLFNSYDYTTETCDGEADFNLIIDDTTYGLEIYEKEVHITTTNKEIILSKEDSRNLLKIINKYVPDKYKPIVTCLKNQLGAFIADQSLEFKEKDITSLINIDKSKLDYSYLETNEHGAFYLIIKTSDNTILNEITNTLKNNYQNLTTQSFEGYQLYVYNGAETILNPEDLTICSLN